MRRLPFFTFILAALLLTPAALAAPTTFTVTSTNDVNDGVCNATHCSLREAINAANANDGKDRIVFNLTGTPPFTIAPTTPLPLITQPVELIGVAEPSDTHIILNGSSAVAAQTEQLVGLNILAGNSYVTGFIINGWAYGGIGILGGDENLLTSNYIGLGADGLTAVPNLYGVIIYQSSDNSLYANYISGNLDDGVNIGGANATNNVVNFNFIGYNANFDILGNGDEGVKIEDSFDNQVLKSMIAGSGNHGVLVKGAGALRNRISETTITASGLLGISLENGGNGSLSAPSITWAWADASLNTVVMLDAAPNTTYTIEVFTNETCDTSGGGEGAQYAGTTPVTTDANGEAVITTAVRRTDGDIITATITDALGNTSAFSTCTTLSLAAAPLAAPRINYVFGTQITLTWSGLSWADHYEVAWWQPATGAKGGSGTSNDETTIILNSGSGDYLWQVRGIDAEGNEGAWSEPQSFVIEVPTPTP